MPEARIQGLGPAKAKIMIVGDMPSKEDYATGAPFSSKTGAFLEQQLLACGIRPSDTYRTYVMKRHSEGSILSHLAPYNKSSVALPDDLLIHNLAELREEIRAVDPNVIIALGIGPLWALGRETARFATDKNGRAKKTKGAYTLTGIADWRGSIIEGTKFADERKVVATYAPQDVIVQYPNRIFWAHDLKRAKEQSAFPEIRRPQKHISINPQGHERAEWGAKLLASPMVTFDIEYIGSELLCVGMTGNADEACVIQIKGESDLHFVREILLSGVPLCAQNAAFDCSILEWHYQMPVLQYLRHDTMLAAHAAYIELPKDLGTLCSVYTEQPCYWTKISWPDIKAGRQPLSDVLQYNAIDVWVTHAVMEAQAADELTDAAVKKTFDFEMSLLVPLWELSKTGIRWDRTQNEKLRKECEAEQAECELKLSWIAGRPINVSSPIDVPWLLFEELGLKPKKRGARNKRNPLMGAPSADDFVLAELALEAKNKRQSTAIELIRRARKAKNMVAKFCNMRIDNDGRFRAHYNPGGTDTGRLSSKTFFPTGTGGNGQNIPRDKRARRVFIPDPGYVFFYHDLERAESLVVAHLTGDPLMLAHHAPGVDAHKELAALLFGVAVGEVGEDQRYLGKQTRHAGSYMEGPIVFQRNVNKLANVTGVSISVADAKRFIYGFRELHPYLPRWWSSIENELRTTGKLYNLLGRPRKFYDRITSVLPAAIAYKPQSTVGDALNIALHRVHHDEECRDLGVRPLLQVHDAIGGQLPEKNLEPALRRMQELMQVELRNPRNGETFVIPIELQVGPNWGDCKKVELITA